MKKLLLILIIPFLLGCSSQAAVHVENNKEIIYFEVYGGRCIEFITPSNVRCISCHGGMSCDFNYNQL